MSVMVKVDKNLQHVWVTVLPEPQTTTVSEMVLRLTEQRPILGSWDWIIDTRNPHELATGEELDRLAAAFNAVTTQQKLTIFISLQSSTYDRCAILGRKFLNRRHLVARTQAEAKSLLPAGIYVV